VSVEKLLAEIAGIGRDPASGGYRRFAFSREDTALGEWFAAEASSRGLDVTTDRCGNQWAWWGAPDARTPDARTPDARPSDARPSLGDHASVRDHATSRTRGVVTGSHLDSVPDGGPFDGPLGVAAALVAVDLLQARGFRPARPLGVVRFVDEEGARFGLACSGSRLLTGAAGPARVLALRDAEGITYADAMTRAGFDPSRAGRDDQTLGRVGAFVELHIEQGRGLVELGAKDGVAVGVASMIRPHGRWRVELRGRADHAGTTRLADRDDPMLALARLVDGARRSAQRREALATVGKVDVRPNAVNAIPAAVTAWLDVRADTSEQVRAVLGDLAAEGFAAVEESWTAATPMDGDLTARVRDAAGRAAGRSGGASVHDHGGVDASDHARSRQVPVPVPVPVLATGAGHDAGVLAQAGIPAAMLFVRNPTGISHAPAEHAEPADCEAGAVALADVLADLCGCACEDDRL
jgi:N-carbamoyl-L-amino-acid hydrolase